MTQKHRTVVHAQLAGNRELRQVYARTQMRVDRIRTYSALRNMAGPAEALAAGTIRNVILGAVLPAANAHAENQRRRRGRR